MSAQTTEPARGFPDDPPQTVKVVPPASPEGPAETAGSSSGVLKWGRRLFAERDTEDRQRQVSLVLATISEGLSAKTSAKLDDATLDELAKLTALVRRIDDGAINCNLRAAHLAAQALLADPPKARFAKALRNDLELHVQSHGKGLLTILYRMAGTTALSAILVGLFFNLIIIAIILAYVLLVAAARPEAAGDAPDSLFAEMFLGFRVAELAIVVLCAIVGSFISILARLERFSRLDSFDPFLLFVTGLTKPFVGATFGLFLFAILETKLITFQGIQDGATPAFLAIIGFLSGFSERFASDIIGRVEGRLSGPPDDGKGR